MGRAGDSRSGNGVAAGPTGLSRRRFLERIGAAAVLAQLPAFLARQGWLEAALATETDLTRDTLNGLVAFVVPGPDDYSKAQGQSSNQPGGIQAGTTPALVELLDRFVGTAQGPTLPSSNGVAALLNSLALEVNPAAANGQFLSPFARLAFADKIEVFHRLEPMTEGTELRFVSGILIGAVGFLAYGESGVIDPVTRRLKATPVGWKISHYAGIAEGRRELKGYWQGRRSVHTSKRYAVHRSHGK
ncbi:MAG: hypothetical protein JOZ25_06830 [Actinobacteria bacterium]|nr:hypothetical protein [Actinomycetota bacterium]